jgi:hypothetical protein
MTIRFYSVAELLAGGKAIARGIAGIGTEFGKDIDLSIHAAARLFQGVQVAGQHVYEQLIPATADATRRDELAEELALTFERDACPARGLIAITLSNPDAVGNFMLPAGTIIPFPGELFPDGVERSYRLLQDVNHAGYSTPSTKLWVGTGIHKVVPSSPDGVSLWRARDLLVLKVDGAGTRNTYAVVRSANQDDLSLDLYTPVQGTIAPLDADNEIGAYVHTVVAEAECVTVGVVGNAPRVLITLDETTVGINTFGAGLDLHCMIVEMSGGGDAQGPADSDANRQLRLIEDTIACPPGHGNLQHWRELALSCPDVDLDDAVVYQHVRGPGSIDIVAIGRSGSVRSTMLPDANLSFVFGGNNQRAIGDVQAQRVQAWVTSQADYFADVVVRTVEWDWRGNVYLDNTVQSFVQSSSGLVVVIVPREGYGPDCGEVLDYQPPVNLRSATQLHPTTGTVDASLQPGHRVWVAVAASTVDSRCAFATIVTTIQTMSSDRAYVTVSDVSVLCPGLESLYGGELVAIRWGSAGPLTQPTLDATYAYYDQLGPGSYTTMPRGPRYAREFSDTVAVALPGSGVERWPPESRRWSSSVRESELRARLMDIEGMDQASVFALAYPVASILPDFEPAVFKTLALTGVIPRYGFDVP